MSRKTQDDQEPLRLPRPVSVEEALSDRSVSIDVPDGEALTVGPFEKLAEAFRLAHLTAFGDLQALGFVSEGLAEEQVRDALIADDRTFREASRAGGHDGPCACETEDRSGAPSVKRLDYQESLLRLLQPHYRQILNPRDSVVIHQYGRLRSWFSRPGALLVGMFALRDINIGKRATLTMTPTVKALYAGDINMDEDSHLRFLSGTVHVRCNELNGPRRRLVAENFERFVPGLSLENGATS